ncbi:hypothetical protein [Sphingomonas abietis]|uniref:Glycosyltransferase RgtA/B/C/D-like domain-containing protein n=1 Tax=Sphingomonas abietis TaxID=3012344 RepID=A0ABY7NHJ5_9SPHN|nr:hypothetical protein [Sphingomonas abietis]WBO21011.1 hypothetical protein PBT88_12430 [Sphingomonas abietis]
MILVMLVPFVAPPVIPLFDLPGHMGRYRIESGGAHAPFLSRWWTVDWRLIGNLGVDLLVLPLAKGLGVEIATKIVVGAIPALTAAGLLFVARERHGALPPTAALALPLALGYPFQFGFVNFALSMALCVLAFGLWLRWGRQRRFGLRAGLYLLIAPLVWIAHVYGWAVLCILCLSAETVEVVRERRAVVPAFGQIAIRCLPLCLPILLMLLWRSGVQAETSGFFDWRGKVGWIESALRDHWKALDGDSVELLVAFLVVGLCGVMAVDPVLGLATVLLGLAYLGLPRELLGSDYADMRLAPYLLAMALLAIRPRAWLPWRFKAVLAGGASLFLLVRIAAATASLYLHAQDYRAHLAAIDHIPRGARIYSLVAPPCERGWDGPRLDHLPSLAIVRRDAFVNDQWADDGAQLIRVRLPIPAAFASSPSQLVRLKECRRPEPLLDDRIAQFPHTQFDMLWLIAVPARSRPQMPWLQPVWADSTDALYRIIPGRMAAQPGR